MLTKTDRLLRLLPWGFVVVLGIRYLMVWQRLPVEMVVRIGSSGVPNHWMVRESFFMLIMLSISAQLLVHYWILRKIRDGAIYWFVYGSLYFTSALMAAVFWEVLEFNLYETPVRWLGVGLITFAATGLALLVAGLRWLRSETLPLSQPDSRQSSSHMAVMADVVHRSKGFVWASLPFILIPVVIWFSCSLTFCKAIAVISGIILALIPVSGLAGIHYRFTEGGIDVRSWWGTAMFIPVAEIDEYDIQTINPLRDFGGWGIRAAMRSGLGDARAFILGGRKAVRIKTGKKQIFLGHHEPERIIQGLDAILALQIKAVQKKQKSSNG